MNKNIYLVLKICTIKIILTLPTLCITEKTHIRVYSFAEEINLVYISTVLKFIIISVYIPLGTYIDIKMINNKLQHREVFFGKKKFSR